MVTRHLVIMVKEPRPGWVKTRLGRGIGMVAAAWWFRHQVARLLRDMGNDPRWLTWLAVTPDAAGLASRVWPRKIRRWPQGGGDLGDRMRRIFATLPRGKVVIVGADVPQLRASDIAGAFAALGSHDAVIGPAPDGGYWLIGLRRGSRPVPEQLFCGVRWSGEHAMADTVPTLGTLRIATIASLADVDTAADLARLSRHRIRSISGQRSLG